MKFERGDKKDRRINCSNRCSSLSFRSIDDNKAQGNWDLNEQFQLSSENSQNNRERPTSPVLLSSTQIPPDSWTDDTLISFLVSGNHSGGYKGVVPVSDTRDHDL